MLRMVLSSRILKSTTSSPTLSSRWSSFLPSWATRWLLWETVEIDARRVPVFLDFFGRCRGRRQRLIPVLRIGIVVEAAPARERRRLGCLLFEYGWLKLHGLFHDHRGRATIPVFGYHAVQFVALGVVEIPLGQHKFPLSAECKSER